MVRKVEEELESVVGAGRALALFVMETFRQRFVPLSPSMFYLPYTYLAEYKLRPNDLVERPPHTQGAYAHWQHLVCPLFLPFSPLLFPSPS